MKVADQLTCLLAKRDEIVQNMGISRAQYQGRSFEFPVGDHRIKELLYLENEIERLKTEIAGGSSSRSTLASFKRG